MEKNKTMLKGQTLLLSFLNTNCIIYLCLDKVDEVFLPDISSVSSALHHCICMVVEKIYQLHVKDIVYHVHVSFLIEDSVRWIAGMSGDWQVTGSSLIRH